MRSFRWLIAGLLLLPLLEIYFLIRVGQVIGALPTIFLVVFTAVLGALLVRLQGFATLARLQRTLALGGMPAADLLEGAVVLLAGILFLIPGLLTDLVGFLCLIPALRQALIRGVLSRRLRPAGAQQPGHGPSGSSRSAPRTLEGEYRREDD